MLLLVEVVFPERILIRVSLMTIFAVEILKHMRAWLTILGL